ncbi:hypothetical protein [Vibrio sp. HN007]|uniref:hypothetical protein n=1 Tax=Vibrio iocasae TaxID=3098914 RepID=UPI0035D4F2EB
MSSFKFDLPPSPFREKILILVENINHHYGERAEDALYLVVRKRWQNRLFDQDKPGYISGLASDVTDAKREFQQCFYSDSTTESIMSKLKFAVVELAVASDTQDKKSNRSFDAKYVSEPTIRTLPLKLAEFPFSSLMIHHPVLALLTSLLIPLFGVFYVSGKVLLLAVVLHSLLMAYYLSGLTILLRKLKANKAWYWQFALILVHVAFFALTVIGQYFYYRHG